MGTLFRSKEMTLCQLFLQTESSYACIAELGEIGLIQFKDLNVNVNAFQRRYVNEIRRCNETERKLRTIEKEIQQLTVPILDTGENLPAPSTREASEIENKLEKLELQLYEINSNSKTLYANLLELQEIRQVLIKGNKFLTGVIFDGQEGDEGISPEDAITRSFENMIPFGTPRSEDRQGVDLLAGVIPTEKFPVFEQMLWRVCRGNIFIRNEDVDDELIEPDTGKEIRKKIFVIFFSGEQMKGRIKKVAEGFHASLYPCPDNQEERNEMLNGVRIRIADIHQVLDTAKQHRLRVLQDASQYIKMWSAKIRKNKACYHILNMFNMDVTNKCLIGEGWCPVEELHNINAALKRGMDTSGSNLPPILNRLQTSSEEPPTYFKTNKFTAGFQAIVDAYGVGNYLEANPTPFTIVTFPFLFAVMFGDAGHGLLMFLFALILVLKEKQLASKAANNEITSTMFGGRYIILLMGAFSIYTGLIYNDVFAKSLNIFGSGFYPAYNYSTTHTNKMLQLDPGDPKMYAGNSYPFGVDPIWQSATNKITFSNSFKMKMSLILGVSQMMFGVFVSLFNHCYFRRWLNLIAEFFPQVIFLGAIFGNLLVLIFYKWLAYNAKSSGSAPSLLIGLINMFMLRYDNNKSGPENMWPIYTGQSTVQTILLVLAVICVPWMLLLKPLVLNYSHNKRVRVMQTHQRLVEETEHYSTVDQQRSSSVSVTIDSSTGSRGSMNAAAGNVQSSSSAHPPAATSTGGGDHDGHGGEFNFGDIFVHQCIHTIEYCLGCISNSASYLRLWALSLAHAQLSEVLWNMVFHMALSIGFLWGFVAIFALFFAWAVLTVGILLLMEGLSAFLHALRLHWVEFQNKFYSGSGYKFDPFSFTKFIDDDSE